MPTARTASSRPAARAPRPAAKQTSRAHLAGLSADELLDIYRIALLSRGLDDREIRMKRQNQIFFQISGAGHELPLICAGKQLRAGHDWFFPYYRDRALVLALGMTPTEVLLEAVGAADDPNSAGRQMPCHWSHRGFQIFTKSSCTGTQFLHAAGAAQVRSICEAVDALRDGDISYHEDEVMYVSSGDGTTSQGEFWESLNTACNLKLPVLYVIEDNGYAISTPVEVQTAGGSISRAMSALPSLKVVEFDGCDVFDSWRGMKEAIAWVRAGRGPALVHAHVIRPYSHSLSDSEDLYRPQEERDSEARRDPLLTLPRLLVEEGLATQAQVDRIRADVDAEILAAADAALAAPKPAAETVLDNIYSPDVDPTSAEFDVPAEPSGEPLTLVDAVNACLRSEMRRDPRIVVFGQDVADVSREQYADRVKGKGGVFKATHGLQFEFGSARVFNSPLAEANIIGRAIGMAGRGLRPVVEIQFFDYIWTAFMQLRNELSNVRWRSGGAWSSPVVVRVPIGGYLKGGAPYHSQSGEVVFTHIPGLRVVMPSNALDAIGLLRTAIRCEDPVMFLEPKHLYRQTYNKSPWPGDDFMIPFGRARVAREGSDLTLITYGSLVQRSVKAAQEIAESDGAEIEVIDLRSLSPYDWDAIAESVTKTSRALVVHEDHVSWGYGAEIAARISSDLFEYLDAPVRRLAGLDTFVAYEPGLEDIILPQTETVAAAARELLAW